MKAMKGKGYAGSISNKGSQEVKAVFPQKPVKKGTVKEGGDLRAKKG